MMSVIWVVADLSHEVLNGCSLRCRLLENCLFLISSGVSEAQAHIQDFVIKPPNGSNSIL